MIFLLLVSNDSEYLVQAVIHECSLLGDVLFLDRDRTVCLIKRQLLFSVLLLQLPKRFNYCVMLLFEHSDDLLSFLLEEFDCLLLCYSLHVLDLNIHRFAHRLQRLVVCH